MVVKIYKDEGAPLEAEVLAGWDRQVVPVPVLGATPTVLLRRYVDGQVLRSALDPCASGKLATWLHSCHVALGSAHAQDGTLIRTGLVGDMNLGNFVLDMAQADSGLCAGSISAIRARESAGGCGRGFMRIFSHRPGYTLPGRNVRWRSCRDYRRLAELKTECA